MLKRKIKQEVDLVLLFEQFSIGKRKTEQSNGLYLMSILIGHKSTNQIAQYKVESWRGSRTLFVRRHIRKAFGFSESVF